MITFLGILIAICSILIILVVLVQKSKGGGLSSNFSSSNSILGVKKTTDVIEKATWILASIIMILSITVVAISPKGDDGNSGSDVLGVIQQQQAVPASDLIPDVSNTLPLELPAEEGSNE